jgi:hypothetical protein
MVTARLTEGGSFRCPACDSKTKVVDSRPLSDANVPKTSPKTINGIYRRRECLGCKKRFATHELAAGQALPSQKRAVIAAAQLLIREMTSWSGDEDWNDG